MVADRAVPTPVEFLAEVADQRRRRRSRAALVPPGRLLLASGYGDPLDKFRVEQLWRLLHARPGKVRACCSTTTRGRRLLIMWRALPAANASLQNTLLNRRPALLPSKGRGSVKPVANELAEMWRAAGSLERLDVKQKEQLGQVLLKQVRRSPVPTYVFWSLTRLGARVLLYGPLNTVLHPQIVQDWLDALVSFVPANDSERMAWGFCLAQLARRSGQRALDVTTNIAKVFLLCCNRFPCRTTGCIGRRSHRTRRRHQSQMFGSHYPSAFGSGISQESGAGVILTREPFRWPDS